MPLAALERAWPAHLPRVRATARRCVGFPDGLDGGRHGVVGFAAGILAISPSVSLDARQEIGHLHTLSVERGHGSATRREFGQSLHEARDKVEPSPGYDLLRDC